MQQKPGPPILFLSCANSSQQTVPTTEGTELRFLYFWVLLSLCSTRIFEVIANKPDSLLFEVKSKTAFVFASERAQSPWGYWLLKAQVTCEIGT